MKNEYNYNMIPKNDKIRVKNFVKEIEEFIKQLNPDYNYVEIKDYDYIEVKQIQILFKYIIIKFEFKGYTYLYGKALNGIIKICKKYKIQLNGIDFNTNSLYFYVEEMKK